MTGIGILFLGLAVALPCIGITIVLVVLFLAKKRKPEDGE
jgi:hypothetical protein